jgi:hypothetical protein
MPDSPELEYRLSIDGVSRLLVAAATAALAVSAQRWAAEGFPPQGIVSPAEIAAIAGFSAVLGSARLPLLVRVALHLGTLWLLKEAFGELGDGSVRCGLFLVSAAAFFAGLTAAGLSVYLNRRKAPDYGPRKLTTGDLLATLFAFSAYVAVGQHESEAFGPETLPLAESVVLYALLPYAMLVVMERVIGRTQAAVAVCLAAIATITVFPSLRAIDPFAPVLIVALRIVSRSPAPATRLPATSDDRSLA